MLLEQVVCEAKRKKTPKSAKSKASPGGRRTTIKDILAMSKRKQQIPYMTPVRFGVFGFGGYGSDNSSGEGDSGGDGGGGGD